MLPSAWQTLRISSGPYIATRARQKREEGVPDYIPGQSGTPLLYPDRIWLAHRLVERMNNPTRPNHIPGWCVMLMLNYPAAEGWAETVQHTKLAAPACQ